MLDGCDRTLNASESSKEQRGSRDIFLRSDASDGYGPDSVWSPVTVAALSDKMTPCSRWLLTERVWPLRQACPVTTENAELDPNGYVLKWEV
jgi:hypothetical protein